MKKAPLTIVLTLLLALTTSAAWASNNQCSHNATWAAAGAGTISLDQGGAGDLGVNMTSPACLNTDNFPGTLPVYTNVALDTAACPDGTSGDDATCTLVAPFATISNNPQQYTDFSQTQVYTIHFDTSNGATPGTYSFHVHANASDPDNTHLNGDNLGGTGWGYGSGVELTVFVTTQHACDVNDVLNVFFTQPQAGNVNYCNGGTTIPINVTAGDTNNKVTGLSATVNNTPFGGLNVSGLTTTTAAGTGTYAAGAVGSYSFVANAATACTTGSGSAVVNVVYVISDLLPPVGSGGRPLHGNNVPIKFIPRDCTGNPVAYDNSVHIQVYNAAGTTLLQDSFVGGCTGSCGPGQSSYVFYDATTGQYLASFKTGNIPGITYTVKVLFGGVLNFSTTFMTF